MNTCRNIIMMLTSIFVIACNNTSLDVKEFVINDFNYNNWENLLEIENVVQLSENDSCLLSYATKCIITKDNILFEDNKSKRIYSFSHEGKFICPIGNMGRSRTEYVKIKDFCVSGSDSSVMILDERGLVSYSLSNGDFIDRVELKASKCNEYGKIMQVVNSEYLGFTDAGDGNSIVLDSHKGVKGLRKSKRFHYVLNPFYEYKGMCRVISDYGDFYIDSYENGELHTLYKINLGSEALPDNILPKTYKEFEIVDNSPAYFKCILDAYETSNWLCLNLVGPKNEYYVAFLNKDGDKYAFGKNNQDLGFYVTGTDGDSFWALVYPEYISQKSFARKILKNNSSIASDCNSPILIKFRLNETKL